MSNNVTAFQVIKTPIILPGVEGRITATVGPFTVPADSPYLGALARMTERGILLIVEVPEESVRMLSPGARIAKEEVRRARLIVNNMGQVVPVAAPSPEGVKVLR